MANRFRTKKPKTSASDASEDKQKDLKRIPINDTKGSVNGVQKKRGKEEKRVVKHNVLIKRLQSQKEHKQREQKQKLIESAAATVSTKAGAVLLKKSIMDPLISALMEDANLVAENSVQKEVKIDKKKPARVCVTKKGREYTRVAELERWSQVMKNSTFRQDPLAALKAHIANMNRV